MIEKFSSVQSTLVEIHDSLPENVRDAENNIWKQVWPLNLGLYPGGLIIQLDGLYPSSGPLCLQSLPHGAILRLPTVHDTSDQGPDLVRLRRLRPHASFHKMENRVDEAVVSHWKLADGTFDREAYIMDEEVQEILAKRRRQGITREMSSIAATGMPDKAKSTLMGNGASRKRSRAEKSLGL
jgi:hypothetical protein